MHSGHETLVYQIRLLSNMMLLTGFQKLCGFVACIMCIFILGPIAMIIESGRIVHSWIRGVPADYTRFRAVYPMFVTFVVLILVMVGVSQI